MDNHKKKKYINFSCLLVGCFFIIGVSYAVWQLTLTQTDSNVVTTGCFKVAFTDQNPLNLDESYPITDEEGKSLTPYEFTITNTCEDNASYQINLEILNDSTLSNLDFIKMSLTKSEEEQASNFLKEKEETSKTLAEASTAYKLLKGYLKGKESKTFHLRLWLDENTPPEDIYMNKTLQSKITIITSYINEIDEEAPIANFTVTKNETGVIVDASSSQDNIKIANYYYSLDGKNFISSKESTHTFTEGSMEYGLATATITQIYTKKINEIFVKVEDTHENMSEIKSQSIGELAYDDTKDHNLRYIGSNPNNYIDIGDKDAEGNTILWRVIGVMNNVEDEESNKETRLKIIRKNAIGNFSWDTTESSINVGYGINEWSQSKLMKLLNPGYENEDTGGSLYWNRASGTCYNGSNNATDTCDFTSTGLSEVAKNHISSALWYTGSNEYEYQGKSAIAKEFYQLERSNNTGKICTRYTYPPYNCNDTVARTTKWTANIGLMYPSDYGYATSGDELEDRLTCLNTSLFEWEEKDACKNNNWLHKEGTSQWTIMPGAWESVSDSAFFVYETGLVYMEMKVSDPLLVSPVTYLKANIHIQSGEGTENNPYKITTE